MISRALTIAGSDSGGGAGIQADLKTFQELNVFGMSVITAVTAQNTLGVQGIYPVHIRGIEEQIVSVAEDIGIDAVKTGMLFDEERIMLVAEKIRYYDWKNVVVDPVMIAKGGASLLTSSSVKALINYLLPLALVITPNIPEAETITGRKINTMEDRKNAAKEIYKTGAKNVVIKGGHDKTSDNVIDIFYDGEQFFSFEYPRISTKNTHGTGCTYAAAITAYLARGKSVIDAVRLAKHFIHHAIYYSLNIGSGHGPTYHGALRKLNLERLEEEKHGENDC